MEINLHNQAGAVPRMAETGTTAPPRKLVEKEAVFDKANALTQALLETPDARPEVVARAMKLVTNVEYPPTETIKRIANLLAIHVSAPASDAQ